ncbi:hypothetical protein J4P02_20850 [Pseudomonas sp. NFXW11]|uniref:hypothetical protein n=1 Tax=Pseudomonas sp. NFXW11 TaxID=2819531 RepID=UPI003CED2A28
MSLAIPRALPLALLIPTLLSLSACQSKTPEQQAARALEIQKVREFSAAITEVLQRNIMAANPKGLTGEVELRVKLDRQNQVLDCQVRPLANQALATPALLQLARQVCWSTIFPAAAPEAFGADERINAITDLQFPAFSSLSSQERREYPLRASLYRQSQFFWDQVVDGPGIDSVGVASFTYRADARGQVHECQVKLERSEFRLAAFKADSALQQRLTRKCQQLDLRQMPDFAVDETGLSQGEVLVEYMPWRGAGLPR